MKPAKSTDSLSTETTANQRVEQGTEQKLEQKAGCRLGTEGFVGRSVSVHGNRYDYALVVYHNTKTKVPIVCRVHGVFYQMPKNHLSGQGCPLCSRDATASSNRTPIGEFVRHARSIHGDVYDYSGLSYVNSSTKVIIRCPIHGVFEQTPNCHLRGRGCPRCGTVRSANGHRLTLAAFVEAASSAHNNRYDYTLVSFTRTTDAVDIICPKHGVFRQVAASHLAGHGCALCSHNYLTQDRFIEIATRVHGGTYRYELPNDLKYMSNITVICKEHGTFRQLAINHLHGHGCRQCSRTGGFNKLSSAIFIEKSRLINGDRYDYSKVNYTDCKSNVTLVCRQHGEFAQLPTNHLYNGAGCPRCSAGRAVSSGHQQIIDFVRSITTATVVVNDRVAVDPFELDIFLPEKRLAIEYHGLYYHSYNRREDKHEINKHVSKLTAANSAGLRLYQFWESEWLFKRPIVESMIGNFLGASTTVNARTLTVGSVDRTAAAAFFEANHLQGYRNAAITYGLYDGDILMAALSVSAHRRYGFEIIRLATRLGYRVRGGASRLFRHIVDDFDIRSVMTYADRRYSDGSVYTTIGFKTIGVTDPGYYYVKGRYMYRRQMFQKHKLSRRLETFDPMLSESDNMFANGYRRAWDAGNIKLLWERR